jgi:hypothetical protein
MLGLTAACIVAVMVAVWTRIAHVSSDHAGLRAPVTALAVITPIGLAIFTLVGPLQHGWARRAGTPASLLARAPAPAGAPASAPTGSSAGSSPVLRAPFTSNLSGTVTESQAPGGAVVDLALAVSGRVHGRLRVRLAGVPVDSGGGLSMTGSQVDLAVAGTPAVLQGQIASLQGSEFTARLSDGARNAVDVHVRLQIDNQRNTATGTLSGAPAAP